MVMSYFILLSGLMGVFVLFVTMVAYFIKWSEVKVCFPEDYIYDELPGSNFFKGVSQFIALFIFLYLFYIWLFFKFIWGHLVASWSVWWSIDHSEVDSPLFGEWESSVVV